LFISRGQDDLTRGSPRLSVLASVRLFARMSGGLCMIVLRLAAVVAALVTVTPAFAGGFSHHGCQGQCVPLEPRAVGVVPFYVVDQGPSYHGRPPITTVPNIAFTGTRHVHQQPARPMPVLVSPIGVVAPEARPSFLKVRAPRVHEEPVRMLY
jgi:hypothetical protein